LDPAGSAIATNGVRHEEDLERRPGPIAFELPSAPMSERVKRPIAVCLGCVLALTVLASLA
jgi:hypothetical protein